MGRWQRSMRGQEAKRPSWLKFNTHMAKLRASCIIQSRCRSQCNQSPQTRASANLSKTLTVMSSMAQRTSQARLMHTQQSFLQSWGWISLSDIHPGKKTKRWPQMRRKPTRKSREKWQWWITRWENLQMWDGRRQSCRRILNSRGNQRRKTRTYREQLRRIIMPNKIIK